MQKARVCDEMINFEKSDPALEKLQQPYSYSLPDNQIVPDFESSLAEFIGKLEKGEAGGLKHFYRSEKGHKKDYRAIRDEQIPFPTLADKNDQSEVLEFQIKPFSMKHH